jgi:hypothetical protein
MQSSTQATEPPRCPICRAEVSPALKFCGSCGSQLIETPAQKIRSLNYLLSELARWEAGGIVQPEQANKLRESYERRREELRAQLTVNGQQPKLSATPHEAKTPARPYQSQQPQPSAVIPREPQKPARTLLETLADPHTIRILLYTGAAMLVVGVVIWLRDVLYLKLQEPIVQATLLATGTISVTISGWFTILRTRLLLTGRALTLIGSLLIPVNFWFLVRSGLINNNGRAWIVCAFCALLYAHTAALLREKLYVYLAGLATIATAWTIIYRIEPEAFGLYALALMIVSIIFLHLSRLFPLTTVSQQPTTKAERETKANPQSAARNPQSKERMSYELWGPPLVHVALAGAAVAALIYMLLRLGSSPSFADGILRLRATNYDPSMALLLFAFAAYAAWFAGRYIYTDRRMPLYTASALALFWTEFLAADGFKLSGSAQILLLVATAFIVALAARMMKDDALSIALHRAGLIVSVALASAIYPVLSAAPSYTITHSAILVFLAATFAVSSAPRLSERVGSATLAHASALFASAAFLVALTSLNLQSATLFYAACALWPFALYAAARLTRSMERETQLTVPFMRIADAEFVLLLVLASMVAFAFDQAPVDSLQTLDPLRGAMFCVLSGAFIYGVVRGWRERSVFGAALMSVAVLILVGAAGDALKYANALPAAWPVATAVIISAFLLREAADRLLRPDSIKASSGNSRSAKLAMRLSHAAVRLSRVAVIRLVADCAVVASASLWFTTTLYHLNGGSTSAAVVLFLALLYWLERTARLRHSWLVYVSAVHAGALCLAILIALRIDAQWFACVLMLTLFPAFFLTGRYTLSRGLDWLARPAHRAAAIVAALVSLISLAQAFAHLSVGEALLLAPCVALGEVALLSFAASLQSRNQARVHYFRAGLYSAVITFALACLRAGYDPLSDAEIYTSPVAILLLVIAYLSVRRKWDEYARDTVPLLWMGSLLLCAPLLIHALQYRLFLGVPAPSRDLATLCASLALIVFGVMGRLRAPLLIGAVSLASELILLSLTSVDWLQIPLKVYLISVGALILIFWGLLEFRREQILLMRQRFNERREHARERFGEWK